MALGHIDGTGIGEIRAVILEGSAARERQAEQRTDEEAEDR
jgi:hypothetical protein